MKVFRKYHLFPFLLFLFLFIDGQITFVVSRIIPLPYEAISFLFFYGFMILSLYFSEVACIWLGIFLGFCFDVYFLHTIGVAFILFPLLQLIFYRWNQVILLNRLTRFFTFLLTILAFQFFSYFLEILIIGIKFEWIVILVFKMAPSLLFNFFLTIMLQPIFEKIYL